MSASTSAAPYIFHPTVEEWKDLAAYVDVNWDVMVTHGIILIRPPVNPLLPEIIATSLSEPELLLPCKHQTVSAGPSRRYYEIGYATSNQTMDLSSYYTLSFNAFRKTPGYPKERRFKDVGEYAEAASQQLLFDEEIKDGELFTDALVEGILKEFWRKPETEQAMYASELEDLTFFPKPSIPSKPLAPLRLTKRKSKSKTHSKPVTLDPSAPGPHLDITFPQDTSTTGLGSWHFSPHTIQNPLLYLHSSGITWPGINTPYSYMGSAWTTFPMHKEDADFLSLNILIFGAPKVWYAVRQESVGMYEAFVQSIFKSTRHSFSECPHPSRHKTLFFRPETLEANGIMLTRIVQRPGDVVLTFPEGYHQGVNLGHNVAEAVNMVAGKWEIFADRAKTCSCPEAVYTESWQALSEDLTQHLVVNFRPFD